MRSGLLLARLAVAALGIAIFALVAIAVLPVLTIATSGPEGLEDMVDVGEPGTGMDDTMLWANVPVSITNPTYYDIQGFQVEVSLHDEEGDVIVSDVIGPFDIKAGRTNDIELQLELDLDDIDPIDIEELVFDDSMLTVRADLRVGYMLGLMWLEASVPFDIEWDALINDYGIDEGAMTYDPLTATLSIPYFVDASSMVDGLQVDVDVEVRDEVGPQGECSETIVLNGNVTGVLSVVLSDPSRLSPGDVMTIEVDLSVDAVTVSRTFTYTIPGVIP